MTFSFSSVLNASIFGFVLIGSIYLLGQSRAFLRKINPGILVLLAYIILFRLICPIEFPFTVSVYYTGFLSSIQRFIITKKLPLFTANINLTSILLAVWIIGFLAALCRYVFGYYRTKRLLGMSEIVEDDYIEEVIQKINTKYGREKKFHIVNVPDAATPMIFGLMDTYIILPEKGLSEKECFYVLYHELVHYYRGHLYFKMIFAFLTCIYWWNPFVYVLNRFVSDFLEMEVDNHITGELDELAKVEYMQCLLDRSKTQLRRKIVLKNTVTFCERNTSLIARRIELICDKSDVGSDKLFSGIVTVVFLTAFVMSSAMIFEPDTYEASQFADESINVKNAVGSLEEMGMLDLSESFFSFEEKGTFLIRKENGEFDLYCNFVYLYTTTDQFFVGNDKAIRIYDSLEEALENEK